MTDLNSNMSIHEKLVYSYRRALEAGDIDVVSAVLRRAESDPELERSILEVNVARLTELQSGQALYSSSYEAKESTMLASEVFAPGRVYAGQSQRRRRFLALSPVSLVVTTITILFSAVLIFAAAQNRPNPSPAPTVAIPITAENADQITLLGVLGRGIISDMTLSPDGTTLAVASTFGTWLYDTNALDAPPRLLTSGSSAGARFLTDHTKMVTINADGWLQVWDAATGDELSGLQVASPRRTNDLAINPADDSVVALAVDDVVLMRNIETETLLGRLERHDNIVNTVAYSPDGSRIATGSADSTIIIWDVATQEAYMTLQGHQNPISAVAFSPDGTMLASGSADTTIRLWDVATGEALFVLEGHESRVPRLAFSPDGQTLASGSRDDTIRLWDVATGTERAVLEGHDGQISGIAFNPDGSRLFSASSDETIKVWDVAGGIELQTLNAARGHTNVVADVAFSQDGAMLASGGWDRRVGLWQVASQEINLLWTGHDNQVNAVAISHDGLILASGGVDDVVRLWDTTTGEPLNTLRGQSFRGQLVAIESLAFNPDGSILASAAGDGGNRVQLWDVATGEPITDLEGHTEGVMDVAFSPDGMLLASSGADSQIYLWDVATGRQLNVIDNQSIALEIAFSPDGNTLAAGTLIRRMRLYDVDTGERINSLSGHGDWILSVAYSPDGRLIASGSGSANFNIDLFTHESRDTTIRLWDAETGQELVVLDGHADAVMDVVFSPDATILASASADGSIFLWGIP